MDAFKNVSDLGFADPNFWTAASPLLKILNIAAIIKFSNPFSAAVVHIRHTITIQAPAVINLKVGLCRSAIF